MTVLPTNGLLTKEITALFKGDVCWAKCPAKGRQDTTTYMLPGGMHVVHLCESDRMTLDEPTLFRLAVPVVELVES